MLDVTLFTEKMNCAKWHCTDLLLTIILLSVTFALFFFSPFRLLFVYPMFLSLENTWSCAEHVTAVSSLAHVVSVFESWLSVSIFAKTIKLPNMSY